MSFELNNVKKPIPGEDETRVKIMTIATNIGCQREVQEIFNKYKEYSPKTHPPYILAMVAKQTIKELFALDSRLVSWLVNENGEIVVGNEVVVKIQIKT